MNDILELKWLECYNFSPGVSQDCMSSLFVVFRLFWMVFWENKTESVFYLSIIEETQVIVNLIEVGVWGAEDEKPGSLAGVCESW